MSTEIRKIVAPNGVREIVRKRVRCPVTGDDAFTFAESWYFGVDHPSGIAAGDPKNPGPPMSWPSTPGQRYEAIIEPMAYAGSLHQWPPRAAGIAAADVEASKLADSGFPILAAFVREKCPPVARTVDPDAVFDMGEIQTSTNIHKIPGAWPRLAELTARHSRGDHGLIGDSTAVKLTADQTWFPAPFGDLIENAAAIQSGSGLVRSRYPGFTEDHREAAARNQRYHAGDPLPAPVPEPNDFIEVVTLLRPGHESRTTAFSARHR